MRIYYSGSGCMKWAAPDILLGDDACIMMTMHDFAKRESGSVKRFQKIVEVRQKRRKRKRKA